MKYAELGNTGFKDLYRCNVFWESKSEIFAVDFKSK